MFSELGLEGLEQFRHCKSIKTKTAVPQWDLVIIQYRRRISEIIRIINLSEIPW